MDSFLSVAFLLFSFMSLLTGQETPEQDMLDMARRDYNKVPSRSPQFQAIMSALNERKEKPYNEDEILNGNKNLKVQTVGPITNPNCIIEKQFIEYLPGKCIKLAGGMPACQGEKYVKLDNVNCK